MSETLLTLIWVDFLGVLLEMEGGGIKLPPCLKLVKITLETSNLTRKYKQIFSFRKDSL